MRKGLKRWAWLGVAAGLLAGLVAMYVYEKSLEDDLELMLRAALQQFDAAQGEEEDNPETAADPGLR